MSREARKNPPWWSEAYRERQADRTRTPLRDWDTVTLEAGEEIYHGSTDQGRFFRPDRPTFFTTPDAARMWAKERGAGRGQEGDVYRFVVKRSMALLDLLNFDDLTDVARSIDHAAGRHGVNYDEMLDPCELAVEVCEAGLDGWWIREGEFGGPDIVICKPQTSLRAGVRVARAPTRARPRRPNPPTREDIRARAELAGQPVGFGRPVVFHRPSLGMTAADQSAYVEWLVARGASLHPARSRAEHRWEMPADLAKRYPWLQSARPVFSGVGDGDAPSDRGLLFFTVARPQGTASPIGFDLETLFAAGPVGWRGRDLIHAYDAVRRGRADELRDEIADAFTNWDHDVIRRAARLQTVAVHGAAEAPRRAALRALIALWRRAVWDTDRASSMRRLLQRQGVELDARHLQPYLGTDEVDPMSNRTASHDSCEVVLRGPIRLDACIGWYDERVGGWVTPARKV